MLWTIISILLILWLLGLVAHIGGGLIHLLIVAAALLFIAQLVVSRRTGEPI